MKIILCSFFARPMFVIGILLITLSLSLYPTTAKHRPQQFDLNYIYTYIYIYQLYINRSII